MRRQSRLALAVGVVILIALPFVLPAYGLQILITAVMWGYLATSFNLVAGLAGQLSLGHSLFFGTGAYTSTYLLNTYGLTPWVGMIVGGLVAAVFGIIIAYLGFRQQLRALTFALVTIAFALIAEHLVEGVDALGGPIGLFIRPTGRPADFQFADKIPYYFVILVLSGLILGLTVWLRRSRTGYFLRALKDNERAAEAVGINTLNYKLLVTALSAFFTAIGGTFYAQFVLFIDPASTLAVTIAINLVLFAAIGGMETLIGPFVGALILIPLGEVLRSSVAGGMSTLIYGLILVLVIRFMPAGLVTTVSDALQRRTARRRAAEHGAVTEGGLGT